MNLKDRISSILSFGRKPDMRAPAGVVQSAMPFGEGIPSWGYSVHDGEKFDGGLGVVDIPWTDYWALRARSSAFFKKNQYGRGIIRRLVTNVINTGLNLESDPIESLIPAMTEDIAETWGIDVEDKFDAWSSQADVCDFARQLTFGQMQAAAYREALITGDVLVIEHHNPQTNLPCYELIDGACVSTPLGALESNNEKRIEHGVELSDAGEHLAYYIMQRDLSHKRIPARGKNGRRLSWLVYGTDRRHFEVRGEPLLSLIMQGVSEVDRYRDSTQRKASVGSIIAAFVYASPDSKGMNTKPISAGATRRTSGIGEANDTEPYKFNMASQNPGIFVETLSPGYEIKGMDSKSTDEKFGEFEKAMIDGMGWALEIPPSILRMVFDSSYSASRGEVKEFDLVMKRWRAEFSEQFLKPVYRSWVLAMALTGRISAQGLIDAWRDPAEYEEFAAWTNSAWWGVVKEAVDLPKEVAGREGLARNGWSNNAAISRQMTGSRFESNIRKVARENRKIADAMRPELELRREFGTEVVDIVKAQAGLKLVANGDIDGKDNI